jgi:hypothetical protein
MSTYANVKIWGTQFCVTHDGHPDEIASVVREYVKEAKAKAKPGFVPEVTVALIMADSNDYYTFFHPGVVEFGKSYIVNIGPRGGVEIYEEVGT